MANTFANLLYHIVFTTKDLMPAIGPEIQERLYEYIGGITRGQSAILLEIGGVHDHVHLLAKLKAETSVAEMVRQIKSNSSKWMNEETEGVGRFEWQTGYAAFSVSESRVPAIRKYIQGQEQHHERVSFRDELVTLLEKHGIEYDEQSLLG